MGRNSFLFRIDGDSEGTTLLKTSMGEKETALVGLPGHPTVLLPASELEQYNKEQVEQQKMKR